MNKTKHAMIAGLVDAVKKQKNHEASYLGREERKKRYNAMESYFGNAKNNDEYRRNIFTYGCAIWSEKIFEILTNAFITFYFFKKS